MRLTIEIHDGWLGRPEDLRKILTTLGGLECPPTGAGARGGPSRPPTIPARTWRSRSTRKTGPGAATATDGTRGTTTAARRATTSRGGGPADGRAAAPGLGGQAGARRQGPGDRGRQEAGISLADPRLDAPAGRGGLPDGPRPRPRVTVIHTGGGNFLIDPEPDAPGARSPGRTPSLRPGRRRRRPVGVPGRAPPRPAAPVRAAGRHLRELAVPGLRREHRAGPDDRGRAARHVAGGDGSGAGEVMTTPARDRTGRASFLHPTAADRAS